MNQGETRIDGKVLLFRAGTALAIPISEVDEILPFAELSRPPLTAGFVAGVANVGGTAVTVLNLASLLELESPPPDTRSHMILLKTPGIPLALLVERTQSTVAANTLTLSPLPADSTFNGLVRAELMHGDEPVAMLLDVKRLLTEEESRRIAEFSRHAQVRLQELEATC